MNRGLLGAFGGAGAGMAQVGEIMMKDDLENLRLEKIAKIKEGQIGQEQEFKESTATTKSERDIEAATVKHGRDVELVGAKADAKAAYERIKASGPGKVSAAEKKYRSSVKIWKENNPEQEIPYATLYDEAFGLGERIPTKEGGVAFTGLLGSGEPGLKSIYARTPGGGRRDFSMQTMEDKSKPSAVAPSSKYKPGDSVNLPSGTKDGNYTLKSGVKIEVLNGIGKVVQ